MASEIQYTAKDFSLISKQKSLAYNWLKFDYSPVVVPFFLRFRQPPALSVCVRLRGPTALAGFLFLGRRTPI